MKKRFALYGMFAAMAIFATACGDDSSSGPEEESSSSIEAEDESSSSHSGEGAPESSEKSGDAKSSSSEAKKDDSFSNDQTTSSSSEAVSSSSEITSSSDWDVNKLFCDVNAEGNPLSIRYGVGGVFEGTYIQDASAPKLSFIYEGSSCENIEDFDFMGNPEGMPDVSCEVSDCVATDKWARKTVVCTTEPSNSATLLLPKETVESFCDYFVIAEVTTDYLNKKMFDEGKYGVMIDVRKDAIYRTIEIGDQTWMAQNMNYATSSGSSCYGEDPSNCEIYGSLYTWDAAQNACPDGWRLPTTTEWNDLLMKTMGAESEFEGFTAYTGEGISLLGGEGRANEYGLSFVLGGTYGSPEAEVPSYSSIGEMGVYWLDGGEGKASAVAVFENEQANMFADLGEANMQLYVRCVKSAK